MQPKSLLVLSGFLSPLIMGTRSSESESQLGLCCSRVSHLGAMCFYGNKFSAGVDRSAKFYRNFIEILPQLQPNRKRHIRIAQCTSNRK